MNQQLSIRECENNYRLQTEENQRRFDLICSKLTESTAKSVHNMAIHFFRNKAKKMSETNIYKESHPVVFLLALQMNFSELLNKVCRLYLDLPGFDETALNNLRTRPTVGLRVKSKQTRTSTNCLIGDRLYPLIQAQQPQLAGKITGMLLELNKDELLPLIESPEALKAKVIEAVQVLDRAGFNIQQV